MVKDGNNSFGKEIDLTKCFSQGDAEARRKKRQTGPRLDHEKGIEEIADRSSAGYAGKPRLGCDYTHVDFREIFPEADAE